MEYKRPTGAYPLCDFHKICGVCTPFEAALAGGAKFHPYRCNRKGIGPPKLKFLLRNDQNMEYKRHTGAYPLRDFHKICRVCIPFHAALAVKISLDLLKRLWSYELWAF